MHNTDWWLTFWCWLDWLDDRIKRLIVAEGIDISSAIHPHGTWFHSVYRIETLTPETPHPEGLTVLVMWLQNAQRPCHVSLGHRKWRVSFLSWERCIYLPTYSIYLCGQHSQAGTCLNITESWIEAYFFEVMNVKLNIFCFCNLMLPFQHRITISFPTQLNNTRQININIWANLSVQTQVKYKFARVKQKWKLMWKQGPPQWLTW